MTWISVDIEADGPTPGDYSMVSLGAVIVEEGFERTFYGQLQPISENFNPSALAVSGHSRGETLQFDKPSAVMQSFGGWLENEVQGRALFLSDNNGFDWQFINWYFHRFVGKNPFGHSSTNINSVYKGLVGDMSASFRHLCKTEHTHHPVDDAKGVAEAFLAMKNNMGLKAFL